MINWDTVPYCRCDDPEKYLLSPNDILFARTGATTGKTYLVQQAPYAIFASYLIRLHPNNSIRPEYLYSFFQSNAYWSQVLDEKEGSAQPNVNGKKLLKIKVPMVDSETQFLISKFLDSVRSRQDGGKNPFSELPPFLADQRRMVARIEELAARIEEARALRRQVSEFNMQNLRDTILYNIFRGKVLSQNANNEPASKAIEKMVAFKLQLIAENRIKAEKPLPSISEIEKQYQLPKSWEWIRLGDLCELITDGTHQTPKYTDQGMIFLSAQNVKPYKFMPEYHRYVSIEDYVSYIKHVKPEMGDILMTRVGAMIGEAAIIDQEIDFAFYVSLCLIRPLKNFIHVPYLLHWLNSPYGAASSKKNTLGKGHSQGNLNLNLIKQFVLPLPPLEEQYRIASYLDGMQSKLDALKRHQTDTAAELDALLPAVLERAFRGEL